MNSHIQSIIIFGAFMRCLFVILSGLAFFSRTVIFSQEITPLMERVYALNNICSDPERQVGNLNTDSLPSLPIGIVKQVGESKVIIAIDSAYFLPDGAYFSAYAAIDFPGADQKLAFAAKDIKFNPKGIIGGEQSKLMLVSQHLIEVGPNTRLLLKSDGSNYVNWSCNGFESVNLHGYFLIRDGLISPPENSADSLVTAEFEVNVTDLHNMMAMVDFSPFEVKGMEDFSFTVSEAYVDMSDFQNPAGVVMPACYQENYAEDINLWRGFYLKQFIVSLPDELNKQDQPVSLFASDMFIDDAGVTGEFGAANLFTTFDNAMNGEWGFSVDSILVGLTLNKITKGRMRGDIMLPPLDNTTLEYTALIAQNENRKMVDFLFSMNPSDDISMSCFSSTLTLQETSTLEVLRENKKFKPKLTLNGDWRLDHVNWSFDGIAFQNFTIITQSPYVTQGYFSLTPNGAASKAANYPISFSNIGLGFVSQQIILGADIALNFGDSTDNNSFSAETGVKIFTVIEPDPETQKKKWKYDHFALNSIHLQVNTSPFELDGIINFHDDDPVYGKGFDGGLSFRLKNIMEQPVSMACAFGKVDNYRYWMIDATIPTQIPMGTVSITSITGGLAYHMENTRDEQNMKSMASTTTSSNTSLSSDYIPSAEAGLFFKAGVAFKNTAKEEALNGDVILTVAFNSNGGLSNINLSGEAYMLCKRTERLNADNYVAGYVNINYDNTQKILDANLAAQADFSGAITADIWSHLYFKPGLWYVHLGRPSQQCTVNVLNLASANAYFMLGQNLEPMPNPPPQITSVFNTMNDQRDESAIAGGSGIACGMNFDVSFDKDFNITDNIYVYASGYAGAGFDMTLYKYASTTHCQGSTEPFGMNYWFMQGQLYAYMGLDIGAGWNNQTMTILQGNVAALIQGKLPKPSYVYGGVYVQANLFGIFDLAMTADFDFGTNCVIVN